MLNKLSLFFLSLMQKSIVRITYPFYKLGKNAKSMSWVVGPNEVAGMLKDIANSIPNSFSVSLTQHHFYNVIYDFETSLDGNLLNRMLNRFIRPALLFAKLSSRAEGFIYIGQYGFLTANNDYREFEFKFLKQKGRKIVCYFTGSDIRSIKLMNELEERTGIPNIATKLPEVDPIFSSEEFDDYRKRLASTADKYADVIFNAKVDQLSYIKKATHPFLYFYPDNKIFRSFEKFDNYRVPIIVHAPSNPLIKGTDNVRAAIERLRSEGFQFEYRELFQVPHETVLENLKVAHIVLNEFYSFMPGVFAVEAMAHSCAVLTSADPAIETDLPDGSEKAWMVTHLDEIYQNLKHLLENKNVALKFAEEGLQWVIENATYSKNSVKLNKILSA